jgi:hypothetical protein
MKTITNIEFIERRPYHAFKVMEKNIVPVNPFQEGTPDYNRFQVFKQAWFITKHGEWPKQGSKIDRKKVKLIEVPITWHYGGMISAEDAYLAAIYVN